MQLLDLWGMCGIPELSQAKVLQLVTLSCVFCMMLAVQSLGVWGADFTKDPIPSTGAWVDICAHAFMSCSCSYLGADEEVLQMGS